MNREEKACANGHKQFTIGGEDLRFYEKMQVPPPTFCAPCRLQRRLAFRNERTLYQRQCDRCHKDIVSLYHTESPYTVYCSPCWWSDKWDARELGQEYDFSKPFFRQFEDLMKQVPRLGLVIKQSMGSDYTNYSFANKNVYLSFAMHYNEDCAYLTYSTKCRDSFDSFHLSNGELTYECNYCDRIYRSSFLQYCFNVSESALGYNLRNCDHCFGCINLRNKSYYIFNKPYAKEEYEKKLAQYRGDYRELAKAKESFRELLLRQVKPWSFQIKCVHCTGSDLEECGSLRSSFSTKFSEDSVYAYVNNVKITACMDVNNIAYDKSEFCYDSEGLTGSTNVRFSSSSWHNSFITYCNLCFTSHFLFGCVGLRDKKYCILNKQYSKEDYESLVPRIIAHMNEMPYCERSEKQSSAKAGSNNDKKGRVYPFGEFFPTEISPSAYNETLAQEYAPLSKDSVLKQGYRWKDREERKLAVTIVSSELPNRIQDAADDITNELIGCEHKGECLEQCTKAFRIIPQELRFYKNMNLPLPRLCSNCRHYARLKKRNSFDLYQRGCACSGDTSENKLYRNTIRHFHNQSHCPNTFQSTYAPERPDVVYCERCYVAEVA